MAEKTEKNPHGAGRKKGGTNKSTIAAKKIHCDALDRLTKEFSVDGDIQTPLEFLISVYRDVDRDINLRVDAASKAMPFIHQKMPAAVELSGPGEGAIEFSLVADDAMHKLSAFLTDDE